MNDSIKINATYSSYVTSLEPYTNFSDSVDLFAGVRLINYYEFDIYKTLIRFDVSEIKYKIIESAYLYLFVKEVISNSNCYESEFIVKRNIKGLDANSVTLSNIHEIDYNKSSKFIVNKSYSGRYIKIDISNIVNKWAEGEENYGIIIEGINKELFCKFSSINVNNPPYLIVSYTDSCI